MGRGVTLAFFMLLTACVAPQTISPRATEAEILAETQRQNEQLRAERMKGHVRGLRPKVSVETHLTRAASRVAPAAADLCRSLGRPDPVACANDVELLRGNTLNAFADGKGIKITRGMVKFASADSELAFILAHEMSHNIMQHVDALKKNALLGGVVGLLVDVAAGSQGVNTGGGFSKTGMQGGLLAYSPAFEHEADYIGLYILARAGYDVRGAPEFWRRMSLENPEAIYLSTTHPTNAERYVLMKKTIAEIDWKKQRGLKLVPEFKKER